MNGCVFVWLWLGWASCVNDVGVVSFACSFRGESAADSLGLVGAIAGEWHTLDRERWKFLVTLMSVAGLFSCPSKYHGTE